MNLETICNELQSVGIPVTKTWGGLLINNVYLVQLSKDQDTSIVLDILEDDGQITDISVFKSIKDLIQYMMEN